MTTCWSWQALNWEPSRASSREESLLEGTLKNIFFSAWRFTRKAIQLFFFKVGKHGVERRAKGINDSSTSNANTWCTEETFGISNKPQLLCTYSSQNIQSLWCYHYCSGAGNLPKSSEVNRAILFFIVMLMTREHLSEMHSGMCLPDIYRAFVSCQQKMIYCDLK